MTDDCPLGCTYCFHEPMTTDDSSIVPEACPTEDFCDFPFCECDVDLVGPSADPDPTPIPEAGEISGSYKPKKPPDIPTSMLQLRRRPTSCPFCSSPIEDELSWPHDDVLLVDLACKRSDCDWNACLSAKVIDPEDH